MNCFNHNENVAVATCIDCNRGLCSKCSSIYDISICSRCNNKRIETEKREIYKSFIYALCIGLGFCVFMHLNDRTEMPFYYNIFLFFLGAGVYVGWRTLNSITPSMFLWMSFIGWAIYYTFKLVTSAMIGFWLLPFWIGKKILRLREINENLLSDKEIS